MKLRLTTSSLALALFAAPALALTPDEVWTSWTDYYGAMGYSVSTGAKEVAGETLTLKDVVISTGEEDGTFSLTIPQITMQATGDGGVRSTFSDSIAGAFKGTDVDGEPVSATATLQIPDAEIVSTGEAGASTDSWKAPSVIVTVDRIDLSGEEHLNDVATVTLTDVAGESQVADDGKTRATTSSLAGMEYRITVDQADEKVAASGRFDAVSGDSKLMLPEAGAANLGTKMNASLKEGLSMTGSFMIGANEHEWEFSGVGEDGAPTSGNASLSVEDGSGAFAMSKDGLSYQLDVKQIEADMASEQLPASIGYSIAAMAFDVALPVMKTETPEPFKIAYSLDQVTLGDSVWALFDPDGKLPREPASLAIDLNGETTVTQDLFDPAFAEQMAESGDMAADETDTPPPFEPTEININKFALAAIGASLAVEGSLSVPAGGDLSAPIGSIKADITGANGLIENLVAIGAVPQDNVQAFRMVLAMFTKPGDAPDSLTSDLEFKQDGQIFANGQQIR